MVGSRHFLTAGPFQWKTMGNFRARNKLILEQNKLKTGILIDLLYKKKYVKSEKNPLKSDENSLQTQNSLK